MLLQEQSKGYGVQMRILKGARVVREGFLEKVSLG